MNGSAVQMLYDGDGNRVAKSVNGVVTRYLVDDLNPTGLPQVVEELSGAGAVEKVYTYGVQRISQSQVVSGAWTPSFFGYDGSGSVRQLTSLAGTVTDSYEYDAFGNKISSTGSTPNSYLYRGEQFDSDLGMYYLRARFYNSQTGRFLSVDSEAGQGQRRYQYAAADPVNGMDPSGNEAIIEFALLQFYPGRLHIFFPTWCYGAAGGPMSGYLPGCGRGSGGAGSTGAGSGAHGGPPPPPPPCTGPNCKKHLLLDRTRFAVKADGIHAYWRLVYNDGSAPDGNYYVMEQQSVHRLARKQNGEPSPSGRSFDFPNQFDDDISTPPWDKSVNSYQAFSISLSHPNDDGWAANASHVDIRMNGIEFCADYIHLAFDFESTQLGVDCKVVK